MRVRRFAFTINNWEEKHLEMCQNLDFSYLIIGKEVGEKGTPHLQGYVEFKYAKEFNAVIKLFMKKAHLEIAKGNAEQNRLYCSKENLLFEEGTPKEQGARNDLKALAPKIKEGSSIRSMLDDETITNYQGLKFTESLMKYMEPKRPIEPIEFIWCYGGSGSGKSKWAHEQDENVFKPTTYKWWEGYDRHKTVLLDELRGDWCKYHEFLKLTDIYPIAVECKNGSRQLIAQKFIVTSPYHPEEVWCNIEDKWQLKRRITKCLFFDSGNYTEVKLGNTSQLDFLEESDIE